MAAGHARQTKERVQTEAGAMVNVADLLRQAGQRVTPQRVLILGAFRRDEHVTADEIFERVGQSVPGVNRSTVYRTLELLRDLELISETDLGDGVRRYELLALPRHHHLVCLDCGRVMTMDDAVVEPLRAAVRFRYDFVPRFDHLALYGHCGACRAKGTARKEAGRD